MSAQSWTPTIYAILDAILDTWVAILDTHDPRVLRRIGTEADWTLQVRGIENRYWRAVGSAQALLDKAAALGQRWMKGPRRVALVM